MIVDAYLGLFGRPISYRRGEHNGVINIRRRSTGFSHHFLRTANARGLMPPALIIRLPCNVVIHNHFFIRREIDTVTDNGEIAILVLRHPSQIVPLLEKLRTHL